MIFALLALHSPAYWWAGFESQRMRLTYSLFRQLAVPPQRPRSFTHSAWSLRNIAILLVSPDISPDVDLNAAARSSSSLESSGLAQIAFSSSDRAFLQSKLAACAPVAANTAATNKAPPIFMDPPSLIPDILSERRGEAPFPTAPKPAVIPAHWHCPISRAIGR